MELPKIFLEIDYATKFKPKPVDDITIGKIIDAAAHAPSAGNIEPWKFIVVRDSGLKEKLWEAALHVNFIKEAPAVIVVCGDLERASVKYHQRGEKLYVVQDTAYASLLLLLACKALGLGGYLVRAFDEEKVMETLDMPEHIRPFTIIPIGYPEGEQQKEDRVVFEDVTFLNKYGHKHEERFKTLEERFGKFLKGKE